MTPMQTSGALIYFIGMPIVAGLHAVHGWAEVTVFCLVGLASVAMMVDAKNVNPTHE